MDKNYMNLFLAVYEEHKQRTYHDICAQGSAMSTVCDTCFVCLHLRTIKRELDKAEADYYRQQEAESQSDAPVKPARGKDGNAKPS